MDIMEELKRNDLIQDCLTRALRKLNHILRREHLPMGVKEDLAAAVDDIDAAVSANDVSRDAKVAALEAQIALLEANPTAADVQDAITRLKAARDKLLTDADLPPAP